MYVSMYVCVCVCVGVCMCVCMYVCMYVSRQELCEICNVSEIGTSQMKDISARQITAR